MDAGPAVEIRSARPHDAAAVRDIGIRVFSATFGHSVTPAQLRAYLDEAYAPAAVAADLADAAKDVLVATAPAGAPAVVGFAQLSRGPPEACVDHLDAPVELQRLYVDASHHGRGVGRALVCEAERRAAAAGFRHLWLGVWEDNGRAQAFYARMGYAKAGRHDFVVGGDVQTDDIMVKALVSHPRPAPYRSDPPPPPPPPGPAL